LSTNTCPDAVDILKKHPETINWGNISWSKCPAVIVLLAANLNRINWKFVWRNPGIFREMYDYAVIRARMDLLREDFAKLVGHPRRLAIHLAAGGDPEDF
jgi:hypothetical protein